MSTLRLTALPLAAALLIWAPVVAGAQDKAVPRQGRGASTGAVASPQSRPSPPPSRVTSTPPAARAVPRARTVTRDPGPVTSRTSSASSGEQRRRQTASPRQGSGGGDRAVPRASSPPDRGTSGRATSGRGRAATGGRNTTGRAVDRSRDRGDRPSYGVAVPRTSPRPPQGGRGYYPIFPGYSYPWWRYSAPAGFGLFYWDPYWWGGSPYYGGGYGYYSGYYAGPSSAYYGRLRLKVKPREAEVFVDGYFAGHVDDFDGIFQRLNLDVGPHRIEVRHPGYEPITFEIRIQPDQTITYEAEMVQQ